VGVAGDGVMATIFRNFAAIAALCVVVAGCAGSHDDDLGLYGGGYYGRNDHMQTPSQPLQCVPYAREQTGIALYGDAWTWWDQAAGHYDRSYSPEIGSIMVLDQYAGPHRAHLAVVRAMTGPREMRIDHANWLDEGQVHLDDPVMDVSAQNDWSLVKVYNLKARAWGQKTYHVRGFILPGPSRRGYGAEVAAND